MKMSAKINFRIFWGNFFKQKFNLVGRSCSGGVGKQNIFDSNFIKTACPKINAVSYTHLDVYKRQI